MIPHIGTNMDTEELLFITLNFVWRFNPKTRGAEVVWIWASPGRTRLAVAGPGARHLSNALYHALRAVGRRRVRRWRGQRMWYVAYSPPRP